MQSSAQLPPPRRVSAIRTLAIKQYHFDQVQSTQDTARELLSDTSLPFLVTADEQSAGRGRQGRQWLSPRGNFFASLVVRPDVPPAHYSEYSFLTAVILRDTIAVFSEQPVTLKWPNDVLADGKKCAGILIEAEHGSLIIGIGVNLLYAPPPDVVPYPAAALNIHDKQKFTSELMIKWTHWHNIYLRDGFSAIRAEWLCRAHALGHEIAVQTPHKKLHGIFSGLDDQGNLLLTQGTQAVKVTTADVLVS